MKNMRYLLVKARERCLKWKTVILKHDFGVDCTGTVPCKKIAFYQWKWDLQSLFQIRRGRALDCKVKGFIFPCDFQKVNRRWPFQNNRNLCSSLPYSLCCFWLLFPASIIIHFLKNAGQIKWKSQSFKCQASRQQRLMVYLAVALHW